VVTGPNRPIAAPPSGGPTAMELQLVDSNRALATSRSSGRTRAQRYDPLAALKAILAAATMAETTSNCTKLSRPKA
jgi:hypothetical protein